MRWPLGPSVPDAEFRLNPHVAPAQHRVRHFPSLVLACVDGWVPAGEFHTEQSDARERAEVRRKWRTKERGGRTAEANRHELESNPVRSRPWATSALRAPLLK